MDDTVILDRVRIELAPPTNSMNLPEVVEMVAVETLEKLP